MSIMMLGISIICAAETPCKQAINRGVGSWQDVHGITLLSHARLSNAYNLWTSVLEAGLRGDWIETGVFRGGCSLLAARAARAAFLAPECPKAKKARTVWLADSFAGFPDDTENDIAKAVGGKPSKAACRLGGRDITCKQFADHYSLDGVREMFRRDGFAPDGARPTPAHARAA